MEQITHTHVIRLVHQLPTIYRNRFFEWRKDNAPRFRKGRFGAYDWESPEFIAECLQKAVALHAEVDRVLAGFRGDKARIDSQTASDAVYVSRKDINDSQPPQESSTNGET